LRDVRGVVYAAEGDGEKRIKHSGGEKHKRGYAEGENVIVRHFTVSLDKGTADRAYQLAAAAVIQFYNFTAVFA
jgi:hypothetical protein